MRTLVLGAGAIGGYFGGRLLAAGRDVTFLVRPRRQALLAEQGLRIRSPKGDVHIPDPPTVTADQVRGPYDLILLSCKAYDLDGAIEDIAPAVGPGTVIVPLLNGMRHVDVLEQRFGPAAVLGGHCMISSTLGDGGTVLHLNALDILGFGERPGGTSERVRAVDQVLSGAGFEAHLADDILQEMWEKWIFIATGAGINCLLRGAIGDIVAAGGGDLAEGLLQEASAVAAAHGHAPREAAVQRNRSAFTEAGSLITASMLRDLEHGSRIEADQIIGDLLARAPEQDPRSLLRITYVNLKTYEVRRAREEAAKA